MILRLLQGLTSRWRKLVFSTQGVKFDGPAWLRAVEIPRYHERIHLGQRVALDRGVTLLVSDHDNATSSAAPVISLGERCYVNRYTMLDACDSLTIGAGCMIGPYCYLTDHDHVRDEQGNLNTGGLQSAPVRIGKKCWLGAHVSVLKGVTIGDGAVVGAGAVVTKDVPAGATVVGNPARVISPSTNPPAA